MEPSNHSVPKKLLLLDSETGVAVVVVGPKRVTAAAAMLLMLLSMVSVVPQADAAQGGGTCRATNATALLARASVLRVMLGNALDLSLSEDLRQAIGSLLSVNLSELTVNELRRWVQNASGLLSSLEREIRGGRAYAAEVALRGYLGGLRRALESRLRMIVEGYDTPIDLEGLLANVAMARDISEANQAIQVLRYRLRDVEARRARDLADSIRRLVESWVEEVRGGAVAALQRAVANLGTPTQVLRMVVEMLRAVNASEEAVRAIEGAIEHVRTAEELLGTVAEEVMGRVPSPEEVEDAFSVSLQTIVVRVGGILSEVEGELRGLRSVAVQGGVGDAGAVARVDELLTVVERLRSGLTNATATEDFRGLLKSVAEIRTALGGIEERLEGITAATAQALEEKRAKELAEKAIEKAEDTLEEVNELLDDLALRSRALCMQAPSPACRGIAKVLQLVDWRIKEAEVLINSAKRAYDSGNYTKALSLAMKATAIVEAVRHQLSATMKLLEVAEKAPAPPTPSKREKREASPGKTW